MQSARRRVDSTWYSAAIGAHLEYGYRLAVDAISARGRAVEPVMHVQGDLHLSVADRNQDRILAKAEFLHIARRGGPDAARLPGDVAVGAILEFAPDGKLLRYGFRPNTSPAYRNFVRGLIAPFVFQASPAMGAEWEATGADAFGAYQAQYRRNDGAEPSVVRRKVRYDSGQAGCSPQIVTAEARARFATAVGWVVAAEIEEATSFSPEQEATQLRLGGSLVLRAHATRAPAPVPADVVYSAPAFEVEDAEQMLRDRLQGVTLPALLVALREAARPGAKPNDEQQAWHTLVDLLRQDPNLSAQILALVRRGEVEPRTADRLLTALGAAGSPAAQEALLAVYGDLALAERLRETAALSLSQLQHPDPRVFAALSTRIQGAASLDAVVAVSMLTLGALAPRAVHGPSEGRTAVQVLLGMENWAVSAGGLPTWLHALGNAAEASTLARLRPYLTHTEDHVRESAVAAMRRFQDPTITPALLQQARNDASARVRSAAIGTLARQGSKDALAAVRDAACVDPAESVRRQAITALGERMDARAVAVLEQVAASDRCVSLQQLARDLLARR